MAVQFGTLEVDGKLHKRCFNGIGGKENSRVRKGREYIQKAHNIFRDEECILGEQQGGVVG